MDKANERLQGRREDMKGWKKLVVVFVILSIGVGYGAYRFGHKAGKQEFAEIRWKTNTEIENPNDNFDGTIWCSYEALLSALIFNQSGGYPVRFQTGPSKDIDGNVTDDGFHVQAQAQVDGEWYFLRRKENKIIMTGQDWFYEPSMDERGMGYGKYLESLKRELKREERYLAKGNEKKKEPEIDINLFNSGSTTFGGDKK